MFLTHTKHAFRSITKHRIPYLLNLIGFATGILGTFILVALLSHDWKFDTYHDNAGLIHKLSIKLNLPNGERHFASTSVITSENIEEAIPEIESTVRMRVMPATLRNADDIFTNQPINYVDSAFFHVFKVQLKSGRLPLNQDEILISTRTQERIFRTDDPINKSLQFESPAVNKGLVVVGVYESYPTNVSFRPAILASFKQVEGSHNRNYGAIVPFLSTFLFTTTPIEEQELQEKIDDHFNSVLPEGLNNVLDHRVESYANMHFNAGQEFDFPQKHEAQTLLILAALAVFILISVFANFFSIQLALVLQRDKELTIKRILGRSKTTLLSQTLAESLLLLLPTFLIAGISTWLILSELEAYTGQTLMVNWFEPWRFSLLSLLSLILFLLLSVVISYLLASRMTSFDFKTKTKSWVVRKVFIGLQFSLAGFFILNALVISGQLRFLSTQNLGFQEDQLINISLNGYNNVEQAKTIKQRFMGLSGVKTASVSQVAVFGSQGKSNFSVLRDTSSVSHLMNVNYIDADFLPTTGIDIVFGDNIDNSGTKALINLRAAELLGFDNIQEALGIQITHNGRDSTLNYTISGVVTDYLYQTSHQSVEPIILLEEPIVGYYNLSIKSETNSMESLIENIENEWDDLFPGYQLNYTVMETSIENAYQEDFQKGQFYQWATYLLVFIAALGVFGLTYHYADQKRKEIGIRKVVGANLGHILKQIISPVIWISVLALIISLPIASFTAENWLDNYQYGITIGPLHIIGAILLVVLLSLLALLYPGIKASSINPVETLREE